MNKAFDSQLIQLDFQGEGGAGGDGGSGGAGMYVMSLQLAW